LARRVVKESCGGERGVKVAGSMSGRCGITLTPMCSVYRRHVTSRFFEQSRVKDSAGPCDCIKDSDGSRPEKKTRIDFTPALILCL